MYDHEKAAFPQLAEMGPDYKYRYDGLSKREYFASAALQGFAQVSYPISATEAARRSVACADALIEALATEEPS